MHAQAITMFDYSVKPRGDRMIADNGISEIDEKEEVLKAITGQSTRKAWCKAIMPNFDLRIPELWRRTWPHSRPTKPEFLTFFEQLIAYAGWEGGTAQRFFDCTCEEFVEGMSPSRRLALAPARRNSPLKPFHVHMKSYDPNPESIWLREHVVDQKYMYTNHEAVRLWNEVVASGRYDTYAQCEDCLDAFLAGDYWRETALKNLGTICILGAGAFSKDVAILNSAVDHGPYTSTNKLKTIVYDYSHSMLMDCIPRLEDHRRSESMADRVEIEPIEADFLEIHTMTDHLRLEDGRAAAFFLLGGTLGNLQEELLVDSLSRVARPGDLFVVSGDFAPEGDRGAFNAHLAAAYDQPKTKNMALAPVRRLLDMAEIPRADKHRQGMVKVEIGDASQLPTRLRTSIPDTVSVTFNLMMPDKSRPIQLVVSKKYDETQFESFMQLHDFTKVAAERTYKSPFYKLLAFEKQPSD